MRVAKLSQNWYKYIYNAIAGLTELMRFPVTTFEHRLQCFSDTPYFILDEKYLQGVWQFLASAYSIIE